MDLLAVLQQPLVALPVLTLTATIIIHRLLTVRVSQDEPPQVFSKTPFIGHVLGLGRLGFTYWRSLRSEYPVFTVGLLNQKVYIVQHPDWLAAVQRNPKIKFSTLVTLTAELQSDIHGKSLDLFNDTPDGKPGLSTNTLKDIEASLGHEHINITSERLVNSVSRILGEQLSAKNATEASTGVYIPDLQRSMTNMIGVATSEGFYGPDHPMSDPVVNEALWTFEEYSNILIANVLRSILGRKALNARDIVSQAYVKYYESGGLDNATALARVRYQRHHDAGLNADEIARLEVPFLMGITVNAPATAFWVMWEILSRPDLLSQVREEVARVVDKSVESSDEIPNFHVSMSRIKAHCPILCAVYKETLRFRGTGSLVRAVTEDTVLSDGAAVFTLRKGAMLQLPMDSIHKSSEWWDEDADLFDHRRFLDGRNGNHPLAYRAFGLSPAACPGRHAATTEVLAAVAHIVMRYHIIPSAADGWGHGRQDFRHFAGVAPLDGILPVRVLSRPEWDGRWTFSLGEKRLKWSELKLM